LLQANLRLALTRNLLFPSLVALVSLSLLLLLTVGGPQIAAGRLTIGDFSALTLYVERLVFPTALLGFTLPPTSEARLAWSGLTPCCG
jgi:ATP-binding cassette subfamily B multidrug efflux pump